MGGALAQLEPAICSSETTLAEELRLPHNAFYRFDLYGLPKGKS
jgi:hypothetical protein